MRFGIQIQGSLDIPLLRVFAVTVPLMAGREPMVTVPETVVTAAGVTVIDGMVTTLTLTTLDTVTVLASAPDMTACESVTTEGVSVMAK